jgi:hypothetical protein
LVELAVTVSILAGVPVRIPETVAGAVTVLVCVPLGLVTVIVPTTVFEPVAMLVVLAVAVLFPVAVAAPVLVQEK